jgi:hypothetical protein
MLRGNPRLWFSNTFFPGDRNALWRFADFGTNFFAFLKDILGWYTIVHVQDII